MSAVGANAGANLTPENVAVPDLRFTTAFMLSYGGSPLGGIAFVDPSRAPVLLCILANRAPDAPTRSEQCGDLSLAWRSRTGRTHLIIGRTPRNGQPPLGAGARKTSLICCSLELSGELRRFADALVAACCGWTTSGVRLSSRSQPILISSSLQASPVFRPRSLLPEARRVGIAWLAALHVSVGRQNAAAGEARPHRASTGGYRSCVLRLIGAAVRNGSPTTFGSRSRLIRRPRLPPFVQRDAEQAKPP